MRTLTLIALCLCVLALSACPRGIGGSANDPPGPAYDNGDKAGGDGGGGGGGSM